MIHVDRSALVAHGAQTMYALVEDIAAYPQFLPWCSGAEYAVREGGRSLATVHIDFHGVKSRFTTENTHEPGRRIEMNLVSGPFRSLSGYWSFTDLGSEGCKVALSLRYQFKSVLLERAVGPVFRDIADTLVEAFVRRADAKFGRE